MRRVSTAFYNVIKDGIGSTSGGITRDLVDLYEIYPADALPGANGFDPADAVERFAGIDITYLGHAYRKSVLSRSEVSRFMGKTPNNVTVNFSNADENRYIATFATLNRVEGMYLVVRMISQSASTALLGGDGLPLFDILFSGKLEKPEGFDVVQGSLKASHHVGDTNFDFPPRTYQADDPEGRSPNDPLFEGIPLVTINGSFTYRRAVADKTFKANDPRRYLATAQWSSYDDTPLGDPIPSVLGRAQLSMVRLIFADRGTVVQALDALAMGKIGGLLNMRMNFPQGSTLQQPSNVTLHLGDPGGTGTNLIDPLWPNHGYFSNLAYVTYKLQGSNPARIDAGENLIAVILGHQVPLPDSSGDFTLEDWTDNPVYLTRYLLTNERYLKIDPAFIEDSATVASGQYCDTPLYDESNSETVLIPSSDFGDVGNRIIRFRSTGILDARGVLYNSYAVGDRPEVQEARYDEYDEFNPPAPQAIVTLNYLRKRYTGNAPIVKRVKGLDFLYNTWFPASRQYLIQNGKGKIEPRVERPADFSHLRASTIVSATSLPVYDVTPWVGNLQGRICIGSPLVTSEVRAVTATAYTADANAITLAAGAAGGTSATASGATLSGGSGAAQATGTVTIGGTPAAGATVYATVEGYQITHTLGTEDTTATAAKLLADRINAHPQLQRFVVASWLLASPNVVTIKSKYGVLTVGALAFAHTGSSHIAARVAATLSSSAGALAAGTYKVGYALRSPAGVERISALASITITASKKIDVASLGVIPAPFTSADWYVSKVANETEVRFLVNNNGGAFSINSLPENGAATPPQYNETGEEIVRIAGSHATNNQSAGILAQAGLTRSNIFANTYRWPLTQTAFNQIKAKFVSAKDDFAEVPYEVNDRVLQLAMGKTVPREIDLTAVDNLHQARRIVNQEFAKYVDYNFGNSFSTNGLALLYEEGDVISSSDDSGGWVNLLTRIEQMGIDEDHNVRIKYARQYATAIYSDYVGKHTSILPTVLAGLPPTETVLRQVNMPVLRATDTAALDAPGYYAAVSLPSSFVAYPGTELWVDKGFGYTKVAEFPDEAIIGNGIAVLPNASGIDTTNTLTVDLYRPAATLPSGTSDNPVHIIYGDEHLAYEDAVQIDTSPNRWELTTLHRELSETSGAGHLADDDFIVLDGAVKFIPVEFEDLDVPYNYKVVQGVGTEASLALVTPVSFTCTGANWTTPLDVAGFDLESVSRAGFALKWDANPQGYVVGYDIERQNPDTSLWEHRTRVNATSWVDPSHPKTDVVNWRIKAVTWGDRASENWVTTQFTLADYGAISGGFPLGVVTLLVLDPSMDAVRVQLFPKLSFTTSGRNSVTRTIGELYYVLIDAPGELETPLGRVEVGGFSPILTIPVRPSDVESKAHVKVRVWVEFIKTADAADGVALSGSTVANVATGKKSKILPADMPAGTTSLQGAVVMAAHNATTAGAVVQADDPRIAAPDPTLTALAAYNTNGLLTQTATDTFTGRTLTGTTNQVNISNGNGVSGNPTFSLPQSIATTSSVTFAVVRGSTGMVVGAEFGGYVAAGNHRLQVNATGTQTTAFFSGGGGVIEIWKTVPVGVNDRGVGVGMAVPTFAATDDLLFSTYATGAGWLEAGRFTNGKHLRLNDATAPASSPADCVQLWSESVGGSSELKVRDEAGNVTTLSPHAKDAPVWMYDPTDVQPPNISREANVYAGTVRFTNHTRRGRLMQLVIDGKNLASLSAEERTTEHAETFAEYNRRMKLKEGDPGFLVVEDWDANQDKLHGEREAERAVWMEEKVEHGKAHAAWVKARDKHEKDGTPFDVAEPIKRGEPKVYTKKAAPAWLKRKK